MAGTEAHGIARPRGEANKRRILNSALEVFVAHGFVGTSIDQIAAAASASKQTIYNYFTDKEGLFTALILEVGDAIDDPFEPMIDAMRTASDAHAAVRMLANQFTRSIMNARVQQIRRLVIAEAARFPDLARLYWERGFERVLNSMTDCLEVLVERGVLAIPAPHTSAQHLAGMLLWIPSNRVMFLGEIDSPDDGALDAFIEAGVDAFVSAHRPRSLA